MSDAHLVDHNLREIQLKISASVIKTGAPCLDYLIAIKGGIGTANKRLGARRSVSIPTNRPMNEQ